MKNVLLAALGVFVALAPLSSAMADKKNTKVIITKGSDDCKISQKEIKKAVENPGETAVCSQLSVIGAELVPAQLATMLGQGAVVSYEGQDPQAVLATFIAWIGFLTNTPATSATASGWAVTLVSGDATQTVLQFANATTNENFSVTVQMNAAEGEE